MEKGFYFGSILTIALLSSSAETAFAGTMGPVSVAPLWDGFYIGGNIGGKWGKFSGPVSIAGDNVGGFIFGTSVQSYDEKPSSFIGGGQIGYNKTFNSLVVGVEANLDGQRLNGSHTLTAAEIAANSMFVEGDYYSTKNNWQSSVLARLGFTTGNWLWYATGGVAFTRVKASINFIPVTSGVITFPASAASDSKVLTGGTYGLGTEYAFNQNWRVGLEGRYTDYGRTTYHLGSVAAVALSPTNFVYEPSWANVHVQTGEVLFKVNYQIA